MSFEELKAKQSVVWGSGPYQRVSDHLTDAHDHLIDVVPPRRGEKWLDVATGTGNLAILAAEGGADTTGQDLAPELIAAAEERSRAAGLEIDYRTGDCEAMSFADGSFDTVSSAFGHMFSPNHEASAAELARVVRPGGRLALLTWHPTDGVAEMFKVLSGFQPARPAGVGNPFAWGDPDYVAELLGDEFDLSFVTGTSTHTAANADELWQVFRDDYGPTKTLTDSLEPAAQAELAAACTAYFARFTNGSTAWHRPYLLTIGTRV